MRTRHLVLALLLTLQAAFGAGGPDGFGYYWESTQDPGDTLTFVWFDPAGHDTLNDWYPNVDDGWMRIALPFGFQYYGQNLDSITVCTNGFLESPVSLTDPLNKPLPFPTVPYLVALFWDDLDLTRGGSALRHDDPEARFTVLTWNNVVRYNSADTVSCQVVLYPDGSVRMNFRQAPNVATSSTIGIQGSSGKSRHYLEYCCDGLPRAHVISDSTSIRFFTRQLVHDVGVSNVQSPLGWIPCNSQCPVSALFKNFGTSSETFPVWASVFRTRPPRDTAFVRATVVTNLGPGDTATVLFGDWFVPPNPDSWYVEFGTGLEPDLYRGNDTLRGVTTSIPPRLGTILGSWGFPELGNGMNLAGITYFPDSARFYVAVLDPNRVVSFTPDTGAPELRPESFELQNFFGDDVVWGIASYDAPPSFWVTHASEYGPGCIAARYNLDGSFTGDTWGLGNVEPGVWFAGIDQGSPGSLLATAVGGTNRIYQLEPANRRIVRFLAGPTQSYRACSYLGDRSCFVLSGGWNQQAVARLDVNGYPVETAHLADLADLDVSWPQAPHPDSIVWAYATTNSYQNTIHRISVGRCWANIGIEEMPGPAGSGSHLTLRPNPVRCNSALSISLPPWDGVLSLWDPSGRLLRRSSASGGSRVIWRTTDSQGKGLAAGVYILTHSNPDANLSVKFVVTPR